MASEKSASKMAMTVNRFSISVLHCKMLTGSHLLTGNSDASRVLAAARQRNVRWGSVFAGVLKHREPQMVRGAFMIIPYRVRLARYEQFTSYCGRLLPRRRKQPRARAQV